MGIVDVRNAFTTAVQDRGFSCTDALLSYQPAPAGASVPQYQVIVFRGMGPTGDAFQVTSDPHRMDADPVDVARETAQAFLASNQTEAPAAPAGTT